MLGGGQFEGFDVHAEDYRWGSEVNLWIYRKGERTHVVEPTTFVVTTKDPDLVSALSEASVNMSRAFAERLMTALWKLGVRPIGEDLSGAGELTSTRAHLEDLRRLVFELDIKPRVPALHYQGAVVDVQALKRALAEEPMGRFEP